MSKSVIHTNLLGAWVQMLPQSPGENPQYSTPVHPPNSWGQQAKIRNVYLQPGGSAGPGPIFYTVELPDGSLLETRSEYFRVLPARLNPQR